MAFSVIVQLRCLFCCETSCVCLHTFDSSACRKTVSTAGAVVREGFLALYEREGEKDTARD